MTMDNITVARAAKLSGLTPNQVSSMIFFGLVRPDIHVPDGSGDSAVLGERNVRELILISKLKKIGLRQDVVKSILRLLSESDMNWWKEKNSHVVVTKKQWFVTDNAFSSANRELFNKEGVLVLVRI